MYCELLQDGRATGTLKLELLNVWQWCSADAFGEVVKSLVHYDVAGKEQFLRLVDDAAHEDGNLGRLTHSAESALAVLPDDKPQDIVPHYLEHAEIASYVRQLAAASAFLHDGKFVPINDIHDGHVGTLNHLLSRGIVVEREDPHSEFGLPSVALVLDKVRFDMDWALEPLGLDVAIERFVESPYKYSKIELWLALASMGFVTVRTCGDLVPRGALQVPAAHRFKSKAYLVTLLKHDSIFRRGAMCIRHGRPEYYYLCLENLEETLGGKDTDGEGWEERKGAM